MKENSGDNILVSGRNLGQIMLIAPDNNASFGLRIISLLRSSSSRKGCSQLNTTACSFFGNCLYLNITAVMEG